MNRAECAEEVIAKQREEIERLHAELAAEQRSAAHWHNEAAAANERTDAARAELAAERERNAELTQLAGLGCDAAQGGPHTVMKQARYSFCIHCGETIKQPNLQERARKAEAALAAERERANDAEEALTIAYMQGAASMRAERDAALANVAKLREVLANALGVLKETERCSLLFSVRKKVNESKFAIGAVLDETKEDGDE